MEQDGAVIELEPIHRSTSKNLSGDVEASNGRRAFSNLDDLNRDQDSRYPSADKGWRAWTFCLSSLIFETFIWGWNNTYGIFQEYYSSHPPFNTSRTVTLSVIGTTNLALQYIGILFFVLVFQRYPEYCKISMWVSLTVCVASLFASSFASQVWTLILFQGITFGVAAGVLYAPIIMWLSEWFVARRGLAGGIIFGGSGIGGFIFPLVMGYLLKVVGFRWTLRAQASILTVVCGIALFGINPRIPVRRGTMDTPRQPWLPQNLSALKSPLLLLMSVTTMAQSLGYFPVSLFIPTYTASIDSATLPTTLVLVLFNAASVVCYILFGRIGDSYPFPYVIFISGVGSALAAFLLWGFASSLGLVFAFVIVFGGLSGGFSGIWLPVASEIGGNNNEVTNLAFGCFGAAKGVAAIIGPIIAASLHDARIRSKTVYGGFGFRKVELFVGSMAVATAIGAVLMTRISVSKRKIG